MSSGSLDYHIDKDACINLPEFERSFLISNNIYPVEGGNNGGREKANRVETMAKDVCALWQPSSL